MDFKKCKITVVKRNFYEEIVKDYVKEPEKIKICNLVQDKQELGKERAGDHSLCSFR